MADELDVRGAPVVESRFHLSEGGHTRGVPTPRQISPRKRRTTISHGRQTLQHHQRAQTLNDDCRIGTAGRFPSSGTERIRGHFPDRPRLALREDPLPPLPGMRSLRALHGELSDLHRNRRRERQPARPDLPDARSPTNAWRWRSGVREHLELCLDCRACESACPSGVQYGKMIEPFKIALERSATRSQNGRAGSNE